MEAGELEMEEVEMQVEVEAEVVCAATKGRGGHHRPLAAGGLPPAVPRPEPRRPPPAACASPHPLPLSGPAPSWWFGRLSYVDFVQGRSWW